MYNPNQMKSRRWFKLKADPERLARVHATKNRRNAAIKADPILYDKKLEKQREFYRLRYAVEHRRKGRELALKQKREILEHYGGTPPKCNCCGEMIFEFLTIDHMNGDGAKHRKELKTSKSLPLWLIKNKFPDGFQILCYNCNCGKRLNKDCPHKNYGSS